MLLLLHFQHLFTDKQQKDVYLRCVCNLIKLFIQWLTYRQQQQQASKQFFSNVFIIILVVFVSQNEMWMWFWNPVSPFRAELMLFVYHTTMWIWIVMQWCEKYENQTFHTHLGKVVAGKFLIYHHPILFIIIVLFCFEINFCTSITCSSLIAQYTTKKIISTSLMKWIMTARVGIIHLC